jgi:hypothetical protein
MPIPESLDELQAAGYLFKDTGWCRGCQAPIAWFFTPNKQWMPFSRKGTGHPKRFESHHAVCPARERFRRNG